MLCLFWDPLLSAVSHHHSLFEWSFFLYRFFYDILASSILAFLRWLWPQRIEQEKKNVKNENTKLYRIMSFCHCFSFNIWVSIIIIIIMAASLEPIAKDLNKNGIISFNYYYLLVTLLTGSLRWGCFFFVVSSFHCTLWAHLSVTTHHADCSFVVAVVFHTIYFTFYYNIVSNCL
jgi:hypothetical protein